MPSLAHEALIELIRHRPEGVAELLAGPLGVPVPTFARARLDSGDLPDLVPTEYRADGVVTLAAADGSPVLAIVLEVQLRRDRRKRFSWPVYLTTVHARLRCPTILLVVCLDSMTAGWCGRPIRVGHPGWELHPLVLGPEQVPAVTDPEEAGAKPALAVLSAMTHGTHPEREKVFAALLTALASIDPDQAILYADVVLAALPEAARRHLEELMVTGTYQYQSDFARRYFSQGQAQGQAEGKAEGRAEGKAEGKAEGRAEGHAEGRTEGERRALLAVLAARGVVVSDRAYARISGCDDVDQLERWVRRAATATEAEQVFD